MAKNDDKKIVEPGELDVLCGRGGMSNHHPGNEWYRRLIKSNRPLYRACPKHTKLLVSKAIVQAVEQQGGRFLEKNRSDGSWHEVTYKRAVDKTSQGLRERERDDDNQDSSGGNSGGMGGGMNGMGANDFQLPDQLSGRSRGSPNLADLADVAIAHAHRTDGLPRSASGLVSRNGGVGNSNNNNNNKMGNNNSMPIGNNNSKKRGTPLPVRGNTALGPSANDPLMDMHQPSLPPNKRMRGMDGRSMMGGGGNRRGDGEEDFAPLPPSLQQRESSMFRLLKQTKLLLQQSETWVSGENREAQQQLQQQRVQQANNNAAREMANMPGVKKYPTKLNNLPLSGSGGGGSSALDVSRGKGLRHMSRMSQTNGQAPSMQDFDDAQFAMNNNGNGSNNSGNNNAGDQFGQSGAGPAASAAAVPALTRLTSQMSDWLTSFWPVPTRGESVAPGRSAMPPSGNNVGNNGGGMNDPFGQQGGPRAQHVAAGLPPVQLGAPQDFGKDMASRIVTVPPPKMDPVQINTIPPMKRNSASSTDGNGDQQQMQQMQPIPQSATKRNKRKSVSILPQLPGEGGQPPPMMDPALMQGGGNGGGGGDVDPVDMVPVPTELEQSVSATLLKLAGTPSKLYSGLSSFFGSPAGNRKNANQQQQQQQQQDAADAAAAPPAMAGTMMKRSSASLLDDDDDDDDNNNGGSNSVPGPQLQGGIKRSSGSLLDDDDDTNTEQRMRVVAWGV